MSYVFVQLYYEGKEEPNGDPLRIYQSDVPRDRVWDIGTLKGLVHARKIKSLKHCDPDDLTVYPPKTCASLNRYKPGKKLEEVIEELKNTTPPTSDDHALIVVAPAPSSSGEQPPPPPPTRENVVPTVAGADQTRADGDLGDSSASADSGIPSPDIWEHVTACARLGRDFLVDKGLQGYVDAADACLEENPSATLGTILELLKLQDTKENGIGCFAAIFASSGTGKTQLAATTSMDEQVKSLATVRYVNLSPGGSQRFYMPHDVLGRTLVKALKLFKMSLGEVFATSASTIFIWSENNTCNKFCGFLYYLLFNELPDGGNETSLSVIRDTIIQKERRFLFFMDEVPSREQADSFHVVLFFRDLLRSVGICPILMSTHTGAENYVEQTSRGGDITWVKVITRLPPFKSNEALHANHEEVFEESERPLVTALAASHFKAGNNLSEVITRIRSHIQTTKVDPWYGDPSLQLMQLFATKLEFGGGTYKNVHHIVGKHFGSIVQDEPIRLTPNLAKTFKQTAKMSFVSGDLEPLLYLALVAWDDSCLSSSPGQANCCFPLSVNGSAISVMMAFKHSQDLFAPWISVKNNQVNQSDGDLLEVLAHAALTLASLKTDCIENTFLGGVPLLTALCFISKLMNEGSFDGKVEEPEVLRNLEYDWFVVPALGGSNSSLSKKLNGVAGTKIGYLERPKNKDSTDGFIWNTDAQGNKTSFEIMVECKNRIGGLTSTDLNGIFARIPAETKCCLIFTTKLRGRLYEKTKHTEFSNLMKNMPHEAFQRDQASVVLWNTKTDTASFFQYSLKGQDLSTWEAEGKTTLLVIIFFVDLVQVVSDIAVNGHPRKKRKMASRDDLNALLQKSS